MSKLKELSIEEANDLTEIAAKADDLKALVDKVCVKYNKLRLSNDCSPSKLEKASGCRLNINTGIVGFLEVGPEQLTVQFR